MGALWAIEINGVRQSFKTMAFDKKLDMNSPTSFRAKIEYSAGISFMDRVEIKRSYGTGSYIEWAGYIEKINVSWDENSRFLNLEGRDASFIIWKKYLEDFSNYAEKTAGFFGQVNARELMIFLLRSPASDQLHDIYGNLVYPNNKEGWGLDTSKLTCYAYQTAVGDAQWTILRKRGLGWRNSGNPSEYGKSEIDGVVALDSWWDTHGSTPYLNSPTNSSWIKSKNEYVGDQYAAIFSFVNSSEYFPDVIATGRITVTNASDEVDGITTTLTSNASIGDSVIHVTDASSFSNGDLIEIFDTVSRESKTILSIATNDITLTTTLTHNYTTANTAKIGTNFTDFEEGDQIKLPDGNWYIIQTISTDSMLTITVPYAGSGLSGQHWSCAATITSINNIGLELWFKMDFTYLLYQADFSVYVWIESQQNWLFLFEQIGRGLGWIERSIDLTKYITTKADLDACKIKIVNLSPNISSYIGHTKLTYSYVSRGKQLANYDYFDISFSPQEIMGIYFESRMDNQSYPRNYRITTRGAIEAFTGYTEVDPNSHISLSSDSRTITFDSYQNETAYLVKDYGGSPLGDFDESFSFKVDTSLPHPFVYIPFCLANNLEDYQALLNGAGHYFTAIEIADSLGILTLECRLKEAGGGYGVLSPTCPISHNAQYYVRVTRIGTALRYRIFDNALMRTEDLILESDGVTPFDFTFTDDGTTFQYRYQALTYNGSEWANVFINTMDSIGTAGERVTNGGFETGDLTGWTDTSSTCSVVTTSPHSGTYCLKMTVNYFMGMIIGSAIQQNGDMNSSKGNVTHASLWHKCPDGETFKIILRYSSGEEYSEIIVTGTGIWTEQDLLADWTDGKILSFITITDNTAEMYVDDYSILESYNGWTVIAGTAIRTTDSGVKAEGVASQRIDATAGQGFYFEKSIAETNEAKIDAWIRVPAPTSSSPNIDLHVDSTGIESVDPNQWTLTHASGATDPYYLALDDGDDNYAFSDAVTTGLFDNWWGFEDLASINSFLPNGNSKLRIKARLVAGGGGSATSISLAVRIWVANSSSWVLLGYIDVTSTTYGTAELNLLTYLSTLQDFQDAKIKIDVFSITGGGADKGGISVTYAYVHAEGTGYAGEIDIMKVYNQSVASGPDPAGNYLARISCELDPAGLLNIGKWRFIISYDDGGGWHRIGSSDTTEAVEADTWYKLRLYALKDVSAGYVKLYDVTSGSEVLICQITGIDNHSYGPIDRYTFEANFNASCSGAAYLDWTQIETEGNSYATGEIYAGYGPEVVLVGPITGNTFRDLVHSWEPQTIENIRIEITGDDLNHSWAISQVYVYASQPVKYRPYLEGSEPSPQIKVTFYPVAYTPAVPSDIGKQVHSNNLSIDIGKLISYDNTLKQWRVETSSSLILGDGVYVTSGTGAGTLLIASEYGYVGGPYIKAIDFDSGFNVPVGPVNLARQRLLDASNFVVQQCYEGDYETFEWWIEDDSDNTFHIAPQKGEDLSSSIIFEKGTNIGSNTREQFINDTVQRVYVVGEGEQKTQQKASTWVTDENGMDDVKTFYEEVDHEKSLTPDEKGNVGVAELIGEVYIKKNYKRRDQITVVLTKDIVARDSGHPTGYATGDTVKVIDVLTNTNDNFKIMNITKEIQMDGGEKITVILGYPLYKYEDEVANLYKQLKTMQASGVLKPDWNAVGYDQSQIDANAINPTTNMEASAKNEEIDTAADIREALWSTVPSGASTDYKDYQSDAPTQSWQLFTTGSLNGRQWHHGSNWDALLGNSDNSGIANGSLRVAIIGDKAGDILNISLNRNPALVFEIKCYERTVDDLVDPNHPIVWNEGALFQIGLRGNVDTGIELSNPMGFWFEGVKTGNFIVLYMCYCLDGVSDNIKRIQLKNLNVNQKYRMEIISDTDGGVVMFNVYEIAGQVRPNGTIVTDYDEKNPFQAVAPLGTIDPASILVKPLYMRIQGKGSVIADTGEQVQFYVYRYSCKWVKVLSP